MSQALAHPPAHGADEGPLMAHGSVLQTGISNGKIAMWLFLGSEVMFFTGLIGAYIVLRFQQPDHNWPDPYHTLDVPLTAANTFLLICSSVTLVWGLQSIQAGNRRNGNWGLLLTTLFGAMFVSVQAYEYRELWKQTNPVAELSAMAQREQDPSRREHLAMLRSEADAHFTAAWNAMGGERWSGGKNPTNLQVMAGFVNLPRDQQQQAVLVDAFDTMLANWDEPVRPHSNIFTSCFYIMTSFHGLHVFLGVVALAVLTVMGMMGKFTPKHFAPVELTGLYWHFVDLVWIILFAIVYLM
jgi:cytochrome c oxidase subunit III